MNPYSRAVGGNASGSGSGIRLCIHCSQNGGGRVLRMRLSLSGTKAWGGFRRGDSPSPHHFSFLRLPILLYELVLPLDHGLPHSR